MSENDVLAILVIAYLTSSGTVAIVKATLSYRAQKRRDEARKAASHAS